MANFVWIFLSVILYLRGVEGIVGLGIRCWQCRQTSALPSNALYDNVANSLGTDSCSDWYYAGHRDHDVYCDPDVYNACVKMVLRDNHTEQNYFIYRDCYNSTLGPCSDTEDATISHSLFGEITGRIYCCSDTHCNSGSALNGQIVTLIVGIVVVTFGFYFSAT